VRRPSHFEVVGPGVLDYVDQFAPDPIYNAFYDLLEALVLGPYADDDPALGILPLRDPNKPNGFTAPFGVSGEGGGLLAYQVMLDQPVIKLVDVFWMTDADDAEGGGYAF